MEVEQQRMMPIRQYQQELEQFIQARVASRVVTEDLLQEVWYQWSRQEITKIQHPKAWLYQVARHKIIDHYRKMAPEALEDYLMLEEGDHGEDWLMEVETPEDVYWREQFWEALYEALEALPENQRIVFIQNEIEGTTLREIAENTNQKLKTVISRKRYAVQRLRDLLSDWYEDLLEFF